jgi:hypothetical protein
VEECSEETGKPSARVSVKFDSNEEEEGKIVAGLI